MKLLGLEIRRAEPERRADLWQDIQAVRSATAPTSGIVTPRSAMGVAALWACVDKIAKITAMLPWAAMIRGPNGERLDGSGHPLHMLLAIRPNSYQTPFVFRRQAMMHLLLWGNFFAEIQFDKRTGDAIGLFPVHPSEVSVSLRDGVKRYKMRGHDFADRQVFHLMWQTLDGVTGLSPLALHRATLALSQEQKQFTESFYANGTRLSGYLRHPSKLSLEAQARISRSWEEKYAGSANAGKVPVLEEGLEFKELMMPLVDAQYVETCRMQIAEIARIYDMPLHKIGEMDGAKFNNVEQQNISFAIDNIQPWVTLWEQEANWKLVPEDERGRVYTRMNIAGTMRGDYKSRMEGYAVLRQWGIATINELRALEDWNPLDGGDNPFAGGNAQASATATAVNQTKDSTHDGS